MSVVVCIFMLVIFFSAKIVHLASDFGNKIWTDLDEKSLKKLIILILSYFSTYILC